MERNLSAHVHPQQLLEHLNQLVDKMIAAHNPLAVPLLNMVETMARIFQTHFSQGTDLPSTFEAELQALKLTVESQALREITEDERAEWFLHIRVLYPHPDLQLGELVIKGLLASQCIRELRSVISTLLELEANSLILKYNGEIISHSSDDEELRVLFGRQVGEFLINACSASQGVTLGLVDLNDPVVPSGLYTFNVCVNVPLGVEVEQLDFEGLDIHTDLGTVRELIAEELSLNSNALVLKHQGKFLFPNDDHESLASIFSSVNPSSDSERHVQLTAYSREAALNMGQLDDYASQLLSRTNPSIPVGGVAIPFMQSTKHSSKQFLLHLETEEERSAIQEFIRKHRQSPLNDPEAKDSNSAKSTHDNQDSPVSDERIETTIETYTSQPYRFVPSAPEGPPPAPPAPPAPMAPPPPGAPQSSNSQNSSNKGKSSPCRILHWEKLMNTKGTVWENLKNIKVDTTPLPTQFSKRVSKVKRQTLTKKVYSGKIQLPNEKLAQNLEIMLRQLPTLDELILAIHSMDTCLLSSDKIEILSQNIPEDSDIQFAREIPLESLSQCEPCVLYLRRLADITGWKQRISLWKLTEDTEERLESLQKACTTMSTALEQLVNIPALGSLLAVALETGNYMNQNTARGSAKGFRIDGLLKLSSTKRTTGKGSLLDYIVLQLKHVDIESLELSHQIREILGKLGKISLQGLAGNCRQLERDLCASLNSVEPLLPELERSDPLCEYIDRIRELSSISKEISETLIRLEQQSVNTLRYFGLSPKQAFKLFRELYPSDSGAERKRKELSIAENTDWPIGEIDELSDLLRDTNLARNRHRADPNDEEKKKERETGISSCKKLVSEFSRRLDIDSESLQVFKEPKECLEISESLNGLFRLLLEFSRQFSESVHHLLNPSLPVSKISLRIRKKFDTPIQAIVSPRLITKSEKL